MAARSTRSDQVAIGVPLGGGDSVSASTVNATAATSQVLYAQEPDTYAPVSINDINQDGLGDCFLLAAIGEVALDHPGQITNMIGVNADGTETVTLFGAASGGLPVPWTPSFVPLHVTVNNNFPDDSVNSATGQDLFNGQKEIWVQVLENAIATEYGGYNVITNGGTPLTVMSELTGQTTSFTALGPGLPSLTLPSLQQAVAAGDLITLLTPVQGSLSYGLVNWHAYMFEAIVTVNGQPMLQLGNPWGNTEPQLVPLSQVADNFDEIDFGQDSVAPTAPAAPIDLGIDTPAANGASGGATDMATPTLAGIAQDGSTVMLSDGAGALGTAVADQYGDWSITTPALSNGTYTITATATNPYGETSSASKAFALSIGPAVPIAPTGVALAAATDSGTVGDGITNATQPILTGSGETGTTVILSDAAGTLGTAIVDQSGHWSIKTSLLPDGTYILTATDASAVGTVSAPSPPFTLTIDTTPPPAPTELALAASSDSGVLGDGITNVAAPTLTGTAEADSTITLVDAAGEVGSAITDQSGTWSITTSALQDGTYSFSARAGDAAGNLSDASQPLTITIRTAPPAAPSGLALASSSGLSTDNTDPMIIGLGTVGDTVRLYDGTSQLGSAVVALDGDWSLTTTALAIGSHALTATQSDAAGNLSKASAVLAIDVVAPPPADDITLGAGSQTYGATAGQTIQAGSGSDTITADAGHVTVTGGAGQLTFFGGKTASSVSGGPGSAMLFSGVGGGTYSGGAAGHNILVSEGSVGVRTALVGNGADDQIFGSASGEDLLTGGSGRDSILGGAGDTTINGGGTASVIFTGGATTVDGGTGGQDTIVGGSGALSVTARNGDAIFGNVGALTVSASLEGADSIVGGAGALDVTGRGANMLVVAGATNSIVNTGDGASLVFAGSGNLSLTGGNGSMQVVAGSGAATIVEGSGSTTLQVVHGAAGGVDVLSGFRPGIDRVELFGYTAAQQTITTVGTTVGGSTLIALADGTKVTLLGVSEIGNSVVS